MTFFAGETLEFVLTNVDVGGLSRPALFVKSATDQEKVWQADAGVAELVAADVTSVQFTVVDVDNTAVVFADAPYDSAKAAWSLLWHTTDAGKFTAWATVDGVSGVRSWEFGSIRVKVSKLGDAVLDGGSAAPAGDGVDGGSATSFGGG